MKVLISGAGIAGPTLAYWLTRYGFEVTLIEKAAQLRTGGYMIDFWGAGFEVADRMGLIPAIRQKGYQVQEIRVLDRNGNRKVGFPVDGFARIVNGRYVSIPHGDLATCVFRALDERVEVRFDESLDGIEQAGTGVRVALRRGGARDFDLVIGADGLHSRVRELVFGDERHFERYLGYQAAAFEVSGYRPRNELVYVMYTEVGQQVARFSMRGDRSMFLFTFAQADPAPAATLEAQKALLHRRFDDSGWECPQILEALDKSDELYFDRVSQIRMDSRPGLWTKGRVALLGDAAACVSLLAGEGCGLAMSAAYVLAGELHRAAGNYGLAFQRYQELFGPFMLTKQKAARGFAGTFAPKSEATLFLRNQLFRAMAIPWVARIVATRGLTDDIQLPTYA